MSMALKTRMMHESLIGPLGVGGAAAEGGDGLLLVGEGGNGLDQARELEDLADVAGGIQDFQAATLALKAHERAHQRAKGAAVTLRRARGISRNGGGAGL